jgi:hypothetical protein
VPFPARADVSRFLHVGSWDMPLANAADEMISLKIESLTGPSMISLGPTRTDDNNPAYHRHVDLGQATHDVLRIQ